MLTKNEQFEFFWKGPFSQWHKRDFVIGGVVYNCAEQFMMAEKARLFGDSETLVKIMATKNPREQKALGREVKNYDDAVWVGHRFPTVLAATIAKFTQNLDLKTILLATGLKTLVEASPEDSIWGIGMAEGDLGIEHRVNWKGLNLLGQALTTTREVFRAEQVIGSGSGYIWLKQNHLD
jgi:ribA/ribD-fused uncharacterized protein